MLDAGCWLLDAGCWMLEAGGWRLDAGCWMLDAGGLILDAGCWIIVESLVIDCGFASSDCGIGRNLEIGCSIALITLYPIP